MGSTVKTRPDTGVAHASLTRPANTTQYTAGDVVNGNALTVPLSFTPSAAETGGGGTINSLMVIADEAPATKLVGDLFLFDQSFTIAADNAAFAPTDAQMLNCLGVISFDGTTAANIKIGSGNSVTQVLNVGITFQCVRTEKALYGVLVARNAYTPASAAVIKLVLGIERGS